MDRRLRAMLPMFAALFIDLFSFGLMYPVIVALFHTPAIEALYPPHLRAIYLAAAFSLFPLGAFFGSSLLGDLSDAFGRKRTLLICMAGLAAAYALMLMGVQTRNLQWLLAGRLLSGLMAGTSPIAQAAMMDQSRPEEKGTNMSHVVLVNCLALVSGPAIGGGLAHFDFRAPLAFAILLCGIAFFWIRSAPEAGSAGHGKLAISWNEPFEVFGRAWRHPAIGPLAVAFFLFQLGFAIYYVYILVLMAGAYRLSPAALGLFSAVMGLGFVAGSTIGYRAALRWLKRDAAVAWLGLVLCGGMIVLSALPLGEAAQWAIALGAAVSNLFAYVGLLTLISQAATEHEQGWAMGIGAAMTAASFFVSGLLASAITLLPLPLLLAAGGLIVMGGMLPLRLLARRPAPMPAA